MKYLIYRITLLFIFITLLFSSGCPTPLPEDIIPETESFKDAEYSETKTASDGYGYKSKKILECLFYDEHSFNLAVSGAETYDVGNEIISGIVPHHLLAGKMISGFFKTVSENRPDIETVIITAPIHLNRQYALGTSLSDWASPSGVLKCERKFSEKFKDVLGAVIDDSLLRDDHSASALIPFVKSYFPEASVSCLLVSSSAGGDTVDKIAELFTELAKIKKCLFVFSVDFSHYQIPEETVKRDKETLEAILKSDFEKISGMGDANMDSPNCVRAFLRLNEMLGYSAKKLSHSNSLEISELPYSPGLFNEGLTSYFVFAGCKNKLPQ